MSKVISQWKFTRMVLQRLWIDFSIYGFIQNLIKRKQLIDAVRCICILQLIDKFCQKKKKRIYPTSDCIHGSIHSKQKSNYTIGSSQPQPTITKFIQHKLEEKEEERSENIGQNDLLARYRIICYLQYKNSITGYIHSNFESSCHIHWQESPQHSYR
ncbi:hypothetical protein RchiOBHm_Chr5g0048801 [Rosa chinensis]|uniref:Uncharacterized protein n=1 Tax=Rosa chinensis TaxID=74649 RepID=A0A2P6QEP3_ROSCH|nr:hypothetical protein RchiOBHm_Chr5g0048801 [Rosa chinensis]